jgi:protein-S-isoprenylcysteine O-methyltransferase Ste14
MEHRSDHQTAEASEAFTWRHVLRFSIYVLITPTVLFVSAGRLDWVAGWAYAVLGIGVSLASRILVARIHPDLLAERAQSIDKEDVKSWDRLLVPLTAIYGPLLLCAVAGLDARYSWTQGVSLAAQAGGFVALLAAYAFGTWAMAANRFFSAYVRIQTDRGQTVVKEGPYRIVRHPGYAGGVLGWLAMPFALGSLWALVPAILAIILQVLRTDLEDRVLLEELPGYREYAGRVRYRLLPGVW